MKLAAAMKFGEKIIVYHIKKDKIRFLRWMENEFVVTEGDVAAVRADQEHPELKVILETDDEDEAVRVLCGGKAGWR